MVYGFDPGLGKQDFGSRHLVGADLFALFRPNGSTDLVAAKFADPYRRFFLVGVGNGDGPGPRNAIGVSGLAGAQKEPCET